MQNKFFIYIFSIFFVSFFILNSIFFVVKEGYQAIIIQFGNIITSESLKPGLHFKLPFIHNVFRIDSRIINISTDPKEVIASDQKRLIVNYYIKYKIIDQIKYYQSNKSLFSLENKIKPIVESSVRENIGLVSLVDLLNHKRSEVIQNVKNEVNGVVNDFGVEIIDVRIKKTDLPTSNSDAIFSRMQSERDKEAKEIRANGAEEAQRIKSTADKEVKLIIANAKKNEQIIKGQGDAEAADIYNKAYSIDPSFFSFYKKINTYNDIAFSGNNKFIISIEGNNFLSLINNGIK